MHTLQAHPRLQSVLGLLEGTLELPGVITGLGRDLKRLLEEATKSLLQMLEHVHVARDDMSAIKVVGFIIGEGLICLETWGEHLAERRVDPGNVLVPKGEADRMKAGLLLGHQRQRQAQQFGTLVTRFVIAHGFDSAGQLPDTSVRNQATRLRAAQSAPGTPRFPW